MSALQIEIVVGSISYAIASAIIYPILNAMNDSLKYKWFIPARLGELVFKPGIIGDAALVQIGERMNWLYEEVKKWYAKRKASRRPSSPHQPGEE